MGDRVGWRRTLRALLASALVGLLAAGGAGCSGGGDSASAKAAHERLAQARALFRQICAGCHELADAGAHGNREPLDHSNLSETTQKPELARFVIEHGDSIMPDWTGSLSTREIAILTHYLAEVTGRRTRSGDGRAAAILTPRKDPWTARPAAQRFADGRALFREICAGCHTLRAADAHGERVDLDAALAPIPASERSAVILHALRDSNAMPDWTRRLRPSEIDALVRYVSTVAGRER
jgi:mono/diheme cytochrome c family protein